jgi:hypothetical protein
MANHLTDQVLERIATRGKLFVPATDAYGAMAGPHGAGDVQCDNCLRTGLHASVTLCDGVDLCLACCDAAATKAATRARSPPTRTTPLSPPAVKALFARHVAEAAAVVGLTCDEARRTRPTINLRVVQRYLADGTVETPVITEDWCSSRINVVLGADGKILEANAECASCS